MSNQIKVIDGIKSHFVPFTEDEEKKTLSINNRTITVYRSDLPNPSICPDVPSQGLASHANLSPGIYGLDQSLDKVVFKHGDGSVKYLDPCLSQQEVNLVFEQTKDWKKSEIYEVTKCKVINADQVSQNI